MSDSIYRSYGLHKGVTNVNAKKLTDKFRSVVSRRKREGVFLGIDFLQDLVNDLNDGNFDGVIVKFGISAAVPGTAETYELVATQLELQGGDSHAVLRRGVNYSSKSSPVVPIHPPDVGSPPIDAPAG